jgi:hypothetical protein
MLVTGGCGSGRRAKLARSEPLISDQNHGGGTVGFVFLPPLVKEAGAPAGELDPDVDVTVSVDELDAAQAIVANVATFTRSGAGSEAVRLDDDERQYVVDWHTGRFDLSAAKTYRIRVLVPGRVLGFADVDLVAAGGERSGVDRGAFVPLRLGATLPIKFVIANGVVTPPPTCTPATAASDVSAGGTGSIMDGQSFNETRAVDVTVIASSDRAVEKMVLGGLNLGGPATVGARIYDATQVLVASADASVSTIGPDLTVEVPIAATLVSGRTYRIAFWVQTSPLWHGSGNFFIPTALPYAEPTGLFRIDAAYAYPDDVYPTNPNQAVPQMTITTRCP